ncbi:MAG TPA: hypothetical protein PLL64_12835 [Rhodothermales bacterium]|nr:hypothetical protein [Rhodothermales bacterium]
MRVPIQPSHKGSHKAWVDFRQEESSGKNTERKEWGGDVIGAGVSM